MLFLGAAVIIEGCYRFAPSESRRLFMVESRLRLEGHLGLLILFIPVLGHLQGNRNKSAI